MNNTQRDNKPSMEQKEKPQECCRNVMGGGRGYQPKRRYDKSKVQCYYCKIYGHLVNQCRRKKEHYVAATSLVCLAIWLRRILVDLQHEENEAPHVFCDNNLAISLYKNDVFHHKIKLIDTIYHFIRELVSNLEKYVQNFVNLETSWLASFKDIILCITSHEMYKVEFKGDCRKN